MKLKNIRKRFKSFRNTFSKVDVNPITSYTPPNHLHGLKWAVLGDSITSTDYADTPYWRIIGTVNNMVTYNYGISGSRVTFMPGNA